MAKGMNQKLKIMYLRDILLDKTDENHSMTMTDIIAELNRYGITAERKSLYSDIENLRAYGMDIIGEKRDRTYYYHVGRRQFELPEVKLLVDSVQSAKFMTAKKSQELIKKIEGLTSNYEAAQLHRQVYMAGRVKTMNESIYYNIDKIYTAIDCNSKISFQYFQWNVDKEMIPKKNGDLYELSPWALLQDAENYYLIAFDSKEDKIKHFRVDKMLHIEVINRKRDGKELFRQFDMSSYEKKTFGMFGGEEQVVTIRCKNNLAGVMIDRFGKDTPFIKVDEEHFEIHVKVAFSKQFLAWVIALGEDAEITGPEAVVANVRQEVERLVRQYM